jgi:hypothetical protein
VDPIIGAALDYYDKFIAIGKYLKDNLTPQYKSAAKGLFKITDNILTANQNLLRWIYNFILLDLENSKNNEFQKFSSELSLFRIGPEYDRIRVHCHEIEAIYSEYLRGRPFTRDQEKLKEATTIIEGLSYLDFELIQFVEKIMTDLTQTVDSIARENDPQKIEAIQRIFANDASNYIKKIEKQVDDLRGLQRSFLSLSGAAISI